MNDTPLPESEHAAEDALKRRLLNRIAVAAVIVVGLLGSLAMFDAIFTPNLPAVSRRAALPPKTVPAEPAKEDAVKEEAAVAAAEQKPAEAVADAKPDTTVVAAAEPKAVPERTDSPGAPPLQPLPPEKPLTRPATSRPASIRPSEALPPVMSPAARPEPARELAQSPAAPRRAPASRPVTQAAERKFALQLGVFGNLANAEDLRARLELNGIPTTIEARVQAGPFKTREEVDLVRAKLKELGLEDGLLLTVKK